MNKTTVYLWKANQSEPGHDGFIVDVTHSRDTPPPEPTPEREENGLIRDHSLYDDWQLIGELECDEVFSNHVGDNVVAIWGKYYFPGDVYRQHRYRSIKS